MSTKGSKVTHKVDRHDKGVKQRTYTQHQPSDPREGTKRDAREDAKKTRKR